MVQVEVRVVDLELVEVELRQVLETEPHFASSQLKIGTTAALQFLLELSLVTTNFNTAQFSALFVCAKYSIRYKFCCLCFVSLALSTNLPCSGFRKVTSGTGTAIREDLLAGPALISLSKTHSFDGLSGKFVALSLADLCNCLPTHRVGCCYLC